jgi:monovalent cation:H+ antiporter-2, CPA2 family
MEYEFLKSLEAIFVASALVILLLYRVKIPALVGFIVAGMIIGPYGTGIVNNTHFIQILAEIGVVLLLFTIGIEFSMARLVRIKKAVAAGGGIQVVFTIALSGFIIYLSTGDINKSVFLGFLVALSSTAIVLKILTEKGEIDTPHGRSMIGILIFQDLCIVPLMLLVPVLSAGRIDFMDVAMKMGKAVFIIVTVLLSARWIVPALLHQVVHTKSRELFITTIILLCLGIALLTSKFGLSLALGAFLAGLVISESEYAHQAISDILPFRDSFIGLFFVSIGMLVNIGFVYSNILVIILVVACIYALKIITGTASVLATATPLRASLYAGLGLAQIGEFSFVLAVSGKASGLISEDFYQIFLSSSVITMIMTPFLMKVAPSLSDRIASWGTLSNLGRRQKPHESDDVSEAARDHVIIIGFGLNGRNLAKVLRESEIPYFVLEMNSDTVREMKKRGEPLYYGDGTGKEILAKLGIQRARLLVVAISDPSSTRRIVSIARHENPDIYIIVRTRYVSEVDDLKHLGADEVIPEEFETSIEIFSRVLSYYSFPRNIMLDMIDKIRHDSYTALRNIDISKNHIFDKYEWLPEIEIDGYRIPDGSHMSDKTIKDLRVREKSGVTIIAVRRNKQVFTNPSPDFMLTKDDTIVFTGERENMVTAMNYFRGNL